MQEELEVQANQQLEVTARQEILLQMMNSGCGLATGLRFWMVEIVVHLLLGLH